MDRFGSVPVVVSSADCEVMGSFFLVRGSRVAAVQTVTGTGWDSPGRSAVEPVGAAGSGLIVAPAGLPHDRPRVATLVVLRVGGAIQVRRHGR